MSYMGLFYLYKHKGRIVRRLGWTSNVWKVSKVGFIVVCGFGKRGNSD